MIQTIVTKKTNYLSTFGESESKQNLSAAVHYKYAGECTEQLSSC